LCLVYRTKKIRLALSLSLLRGSRPTSDRASGKRCTQSALNFIQIALFTFGGVAPERVNTVETRDKVNPVFGEAIASGGVKRRQHFPLIFFGYFK